MPLAISPDHASRPSRNVSLGAQNTNKLDATAPDSSNSLMPNIVSDAAHSDAQQRVPIGTSGPLSHAKLQRMLTALEIPPGPRLGPRVEHLLVSSDCMAVDALRSSLGLPESFAVELLRFGAVHYSPVHPQLPSYRKYITLESLDHRSRVEHARATNISRLGKDPRLSVPRRLLSNQEVVQGGYMRAHLHPKRFHAAYTADWPGRVLADCPQFVVLNKPPGVQVTPTVDNVLESCLAMGAQAVQRQEPLLITHRLDTCTEGVLVLGKTVEFVRGFNSLMQIPGAVSKLYRAVSQQAAPLGILEDYVMMQHRTAGNAPHSVTVPEGTPSAAMCQLEVLSVTQVELTGEARQRWGPQAYEHTIRLVTGRTHQIRLQLAVRGAALLGDSLYNTDEIAEADAGLPDDVAPGLQGKRDVVSPIGLQAYRLDIHDSDQLMGSEHVHFEAELPWWRRTHNESTASVCN